jgi:hypothetical protein
MLISISLSTRGLHFLALCARRPRDYTWEDIIYMYYIFFPDTTQM